MTGSSTAASPNGKHGIGHTSPWYGTLLLVHHCATNGCTTAPNTHLQGTAEMAMRHTFTATLRLARGVLGPILSGSTRIAHLHPIHDSRGPPQLTRAGAVVECLHILQLGQRVGLKTPKPLGPSSANPQPHTATSPESVSGPYHAPRLRRPCEPFASFTALPNIATAPASAVPSTPRFFRANRGRLGRAPFRRAARKPCLFLPPICHNRKVAKQAIP